MAETPSTRSLVTAAAATAAVGLVAYAIYFDYRRRNDTEFRKKLKKEKKRVQKSVQQSQAQEPATSTGAITPAALKEVMLQVKNEPQPQTSEEKEAYFMEQVSNGERLAAMGPQHYLSAATAFFRALRVYPSPVELIVIYQKTVIEPVFKLVMDMTNLDFADRIEGYFNYFPPKRMNVTVQQSEPVPSQGARNVLVLEKDVAAGEFIYKEFPAVTALDVDLQGKGTHCGHCLRVIDSESSLKLSDDESCPLPNAYCSKDCMVSAKTQYHTLLFTNEPPLPAEIPVDTPSPENAEARRQAQVAFADYVREHGKTSPLLIARLIARQIAFETLSMAAAVNPAAAAAAKETAERDFTTAEAAATGDSWKLGDHIERLRFTPVTPDDQQHTLLSKVMSSVLPGLEEFVTLDAVDKLRGRMAYNAYGVCYDGGRDDRPEPTQRPEDQEYTRTPHGTSRQVGSALYTLSSYLIHSCEPTARPEFASGNSELSLIATRDLKKGDVLSVAFIDIDQHNGESVIDCRRRRRKALARGWSFACGCERCVRELNEAEAEKLAAETAAASPSDVPAASTSDEEIDENMQDGSKVEDVLGKFDARRESVESAAAADAIE